MRKDWEPVADMMVRLSMPVPEAGCHAWLGKIGTGGYAYVSYREPGRKRFTRKAATVALELAGRPRPEGLEVDHLCRMRWCVNPDHMRYTTRSGNSRNRSAYVMKGLKRTLEERIEYLAEWRAQNKEHIRQYAIANKDRINSQRRARRNRYDGAKS